MEEQTTTTQDLDVASDRNEDRCTQDDWKEHAAAYRDLGKAIQNELGRHFRKTAQLGVPSRESLSAALRTCLESVQRLTLDLVKELNRPPAVRGGHESGGLSPCEMVGVALRKDLTFNQEWVLSGWVDDAFYWTVRQVLILGTGRKEEVDALHWSEFNE